MAVQSEEGDERMKAEWVVGRYLKERGGVGQIKERKVRERTFGTSSRTKSNFAPMAKLSYFPRNMHARGRAQVFQQRFPASYLRRRAFSYEGSFPASRVRYTNVYIREMADKIPIVVTRHSRETLLVISLTTRISLNSWKTIFHLDMLSRSFPQ